MSGNITMELRTWAEHQSACGAVRGSTEALMQIADRIDEAHGALVELARRDGYDSGFASADDWYADRDDEELAGHGLMRLPLDESGEPWNIGDACDVAGRKNYVLFVSDTSVMVAKSKDMWNMGVSLPAGEFGHWEPTPAERINGIMGSMGLYADSDTVPSSLVGEWYDELAGIADELEGGAE